VEAIRVFPAAGVAKQRKWLRPLLYLIKALRMQVDCH